MTKVLLTYNNFSRAKVDHDVNGRFDLPIYRSGADVFRNFISNFKGNAIYRYGFESIYEFEDCELVEFRFSDEQSYILLFYENKIRFLSYDGFNNFGWVLDGGLPLEVATPYTLAEAKQLKYTQNADVMVITHKDHAPRKLIRTAANAFTFNEFARKDDPFGLTYDATKVITGITQAANAVVTSTAHGYSTGDMVRITGVAGMTQINNYTARVTVINANSYSIDVDTTAFTAYTSGGVSAKSLTGDFPALCLFYKARLFYGASRLKTTSIWASETGNFDIFTLPDLVTDTSALRLTIADITQPIENLFGGDNSLIAFSRQGLVAINGGGVGEDITAENVTATITSAEGAGSAIPLSKDGLIFYISKNNRSMYYFRYDLLTESFVAQDANFISYDITKGGISSIRYIKDRNDLIVGVRGDGCLVNLNFQREEQIVGWSEAKTSGLFKKIAVISDNNGDPQLFALVNRDGVFYIEHQVPYVEFAMRSDFFTGDELADDEAYIRYVAEQLKQCCFLDNALSLSGLQSNAITYDSMAETITATSPVFASDDVGKHIVYKTLTGYESGRFEITGYTSSTVVDVMVLQEPTQNTYTDWYLTFEEVAGLNQFEGKTIAVVTDGGYLRDYVIDSSGVIDLGSQASQAWFGLKYRGVVKSFPLGFQAGAGNTQVTPKAVTKAHIRFVSSAGGKFGSSEYRLEPVQLLSQNDQNYLPPIVMDGTKFVSITDSYDIDKYFYIVQDEPLPFTATCVIIEGNYVA